ncbi:unnamed protein product [Paramecium octaurelia]|uniref:Uncharacterized protein n=1 Tax=Paramecium octaurelia TaxID=43137 RepID=A0A8S1UX09_PAROT|nr:unnamed protein product [Paramecium octaurelia]
MGNNIQKFQDINLMQGWIASQNYNGNIFVKKVSIWSDKQLIMNHNSESLMLILFSYYTISLYQRAVGDLEILLCQFQDVLRVAMIFIIVIIGEVLSHRGMNQWVGENDNTQPAIYICVSFDLVGGLPNLAPADKLEKTIENLTPQNKIQVNLQIWKIDSQNNENFQLLVDDQIKTYAIF